MIRSNIYILADEGRLGEYLCSRVSDVFDRNDRQLLGAHVEGDGVLVAVFLRAHSKRDEVLHVATHVQESGRHIQVPEVLVRFVLRVEVRGDVIPYKISFNLIVFN